MTMKMDPERLGRSLKPVPNNRYINLRTFPAN